MVIKALGVRVKNNTMRNIQYFLILAYITFVGVKILISLDSNTDKVIEEIHNHKECLEEIERLELFIEYFKINNPDTDLIDARIYVGENKTSKNHY